SSRRGRTSEIRSRRRRTEAGSASCRIETRSDRLTSRPPPAGTVARTWPAAPSRWPSRGVAARLRTGSRTPTCSSTRCAGGNSPSAVPTGGIAKLSSISSTGRPARARARAAVSPETPAPRIRIIVSVPEGFSSLLEDALELCEVARNGPGVLLELLVAHGAAAQREHHLAAARVQRDHAHRVQGGFTGGQRDRVDEHAVGVVGHEADQHPAHRGRHRPLLDLPLDIAATEAGGPGRKIARIADVVVHLPLRAVDDRGQMPGREGRDLTHDIDANRRPGNRSAAGPGRGRGPPGPPGPPPPLRRGWPAHGP